MEKQILVTRSSMPDYNEYCDEIKQIFESHYLTNGGPIHNKFKQQLEEYCGGKVELFTNGHQALLVALQALELKGEVITTPFTFASTTHSIVASGLTPVFCDIKDDYTIDEDKIESLITEKTSAIMPVHVYGNICDVDKIQKIADKYGLKVIYDAAHAFGEKKDGKNVATFGDVSMFSFHATKVFNTIEGGCLVLKDEKVQEKIAKIRNFGISGEDVEYVGTNAKMNEFQAAMGVCNLRHLEDEIAKRKQVYETYNAVLKDVVGIKLNTEQNIERNYAYYPALFTEEYGLNRDEVVDLLKSHNIFARKYFYPATNELGCYKYLGKSTTPIASNVSQNILCLPMYADLTIDDVTRICEILKTKK
ncbi:MAG: DegT/DnrJ/EryC1/StrS family aminotransferase [Eubacteriales bacterium]|nr:DegT/DnrJ/EryC1/StrS family aminotransferase [Eubacteriales bacterium]MDY5440129.1 DegT/DnrJ/EryC1/StrS family aminotransferase [Eubacteriales bacterium]